MLLLTRHLASGTRHLLPRATVKVRHRLGQAFERNRVPRFLTGATDTQAVAALQIDLTHPARVGDDRPLHSGRSGIIADLHAARRHHARARHQLVPWCRAAQKNDNIPEAVIGDALGAVRPLQAHRPYIELLSRCYRKRFSSIGRPDMADIFYRNP